MRSGFDPYQNYFAQKEQMKKREDFTARIAKFMRWHYDQVIAERRAMARNRAYIDNKDYFEKIRVKPYLASMKLVLDLARECGVEADAELYNQLTKKEA